MKKFSAFITLACLFALLALAAPALALALDTAVLDTARGAAAQALKTDPAYRQAVAAGDREAQQKIAEATTRAMIISHVQATFNPLQMRVDKKIDEVLERAWDKIGTKMMFC